MRIQRNDEKDVFGYNFNRDTTNYIAYTYILCLHSGYLSTGDEECSGNWGLKDQALLLKWVQSNIEAFGGDPERITLVGKVHCAFNMESCYISLYANTANI